jgi:ABC-2 type transport system ATP-binding protein/lipopolysaccharide transport system ATP-binding protein
LELKPMGGIVLENVSVDFPLYGGHRNLRTVILRHATARLRHLSTGSDRKVIRALRDVSLRLEDGDRLGLVGHNGAGKSTLLRVMAGIYEPTRGRVLADGTITILSRMLPGLDLEDDGYGNLLIAGMLLGMTRDQVAGKMPAIEELSELDTFLSFPVRTYSSGMIARLGFSLMTAVDSSILLIDESIATSDASFTARAVVRINEVMDDGKILVLASHSLDLVRAMCNKVALVHGGRIAAIGPVEEMLDRYDAMNRGSAPPERD